jgi:hypothetical protein
MHWIDLHKYIIQSIDEIESSYSVTRLFTFFRCVYACERSGIFVLLIMVGWWVPCTEADAAFSCS